MSEQIDWSRAPEGATHYYQHTEEWYLAGYGCAPLVWTGMWCKAFQFAQREHKCIERPTTPSWSGEGLPPVGVVCEMHHESWQPNNWPKVTVRYASAEYFITTDDAGEQHWHAHSVKFRPIRTPEQVAADEREAAIKEIEELIAGYSYRNCAEILHDKGYRKP